MYHFSILHLYALLLLLLWLSSFFRRSHSSKSLLSLFGVVAIFISIFEQNYITTLGNGTDLLNLCPLSNHFAVCAPFHAYLLRNHLWISNLFSLTETSESMVYHILQADVTTEGCSLIPQQPSASPNCNYDVVIPHNKVVRRQTTITVLPEEDPLLSPRKDETFFEDNFKLQLNRLTSNVSLF